MTAHAFLMMVMTTGLLLGAAAVQDQPSRALIDGTGPGWVSLKEADFVNVNCDPETWSWRPEGVLYCTGQPVGVIRSKEQYTNFELVLQWQHLKSGGNSGVFVWAPEGPLLELKRNQLPAGIEVQVLDHGYTEQYEKSTGKKATWFTTHGDVFPVGAAKLKPFAPLSPDGSRSFPRKNNSNGINQWNHYYIRCINGEVRLWVNGEEVSGGNGAEPKRGYLCLESEGSPIKFKEMRIRVLP